MPEEPIIRPNFSGTPAVRGTRLSIYSIMDFHIAGDSAAFVAESFGIGLEDAQAAMQYIDEHREELMPRYLEIVERNRRGNSSHVEALFAKSHEKLMRLKAEMDPINAGKPTTGAADVRVAG